MYTSKQRDSFVSKAVSLIIWGLLHPDCKYHDYYALSDAGDVQPLFAKDSISNQPPEFIYDAWREEIEVYSDAYRDDYSPELDYDEEVLGQYTPMSSPGKISLSIHTLRNHFSRHIQHLISAGYSLTFYDISNLSHIYVRKTVFHEYFHHYTDVQRQLFGSYYYKDTEEALAVAWSRMKIEQYTKNNKYWKTPVNTPPYQKFKRDIYNFWQPGYKDWEQYYDPKSDDKSTFCDTVRTYTMPSGSSKLKQNGINIEALILDSIDSIYRTSDAATLHFKLQ